jgi:hypothetical protein
MRREEEMRIGKIKVEEKRRKEEKREREGEEKRGKR